ncbi:MAG: hypothetical protein GX106_01695 [Candidatus Cloacimonetes bacterium]|jgi:3-phosphoshikimate 1-carboxyvinyltransferase|nr:hypothetical protein [Candidatus Cloacimonadota bacterium]
MVVEQMDTKIPGSKSILQRLQLLLAYARKGIVIKNFNPCDDALEMERALETFGFIVEKIEPRVYRFDPSCHAQSTHNYEFAESATAFRLWLGFLASSTNINSKIRLSENLIRRGFAPLVDALRSLGAEIYTQDRNILIHGKTLSGTRASAEGETSSQYLSSLIFATLNMKSAPILQLPSTQVSLPYIRLSLDLLKHFGVGHTQNHTQIRLEKCELKLPDSFEIDSDLSTAAFFIALGAISQKGLSFPLKNNPLLPQPDGVIIDLIREMGGDISIIDSTCRIKHKPLNGFDFSIQDNPDLMPVLSILALFCTSPSSIRDVSRLKHKESNRLLGITRAFDEIGARYSLVENSLHVHPLQNSPKPAVLDTQGDHRLAMAFLLLKSRFEQISPSETQSLSKSCPSCLARFLEISALMQN